MIISSTLNPKLPTSYKFNPEVALNLSGPSPPLLCEIERGPAGTTVAQGLNLGFIGFKSLQLSKTFSGG